MLLYMVQYKRGRDTTNKNKVGKQYEVQSQP